MPRPLVLVAASGLARETADAVAALDEYVVAGYLDDNAELRGHRYSGVEVLGPLDHIVDYPDASVVICAGKGSARQAIAARLESAGVTAERYATVVHPSVVVPGSCQVGAGSVVLAGSVLTSTITLGRHTVLMPHVTLTHDDEVADFATLCAGVTVGGSVTIGVRSYIGMQASIRERCRIGTDAIVGMGAVVLNDVPDAAVWVGNPARPLRSGAVANGTTSTLLSGGRSEGRP
jgi:sugar O-acyltransferase (sialic acid O-acetyltransferase NeuD family)